MMRGTAGRNGRMKTVSGEAKSSAVPVHADSAAGLHESGRSAPATQPMLAMRVIAGTISTRLLNCQDTPTTS